MVEGDTGPADDQGEHNQVSGRGTQDAVLFIVVETPDILDRDGFGFKLEGWEFLGKKEFVESAEKRFIQRLKGVRSQQEMELGLFTDTWVRARDEGGASARIGVGIYFC
jgi:hypothetical protein